VFEKNPILLLGLRVQKGQINLGHVAVQEKQVKWQSQITAYQAELFGETLLDNSTKY